MSLILQPMLTSLSFLLILSTYTQNKYGDNTEPCRTPFDTEKQAEKHLPHLTIVLDDSNFPQTSSTLDEILATSPQPDINITHALSTCSVADWTEEGRIVWTIFFFDTIAR